jgi:hypothetical protein
MAKIQTGDFIAELQRRGFDGFDTADLIRYLNFGYRKIARLTKWSWEEGQLNVTLNPGEFAKSLVTDLPTVKSVRAVSGTTVNYETRLTAIADDEFYNEWAAFNLASSDNRGEPNRYWLGATSLYFLPPPVAVRTFTITAEQRTAELDQTTNTVLVTPEEYDEAVLLAAEEHCHVRARQPQFADVNRKLLEEFFDDALADDTTRSTDLIERVTPGRTCL